MKKLNMELVRATKNNDPLEMERLIKEGADVNYKDDFGIPVLHWATNHANSHTIELLVEHGADVNAQDKDGKTKLMIFASYGDQDVVRYLLGKGADVSIKDNNGRDALDYVSDILCLYEEEQDERIQYIKVVEMLEAAQNLKVSPGLFKENAVKEYVLTLCEGEHEEEIVHAFLTDFEVDMINKDLAGELGCEFTITTVSGAVIEIGIVDNIAPINIELNRDVAEYRENFSLDGKITAIDDKIRKDEAYVKEGMGACNGISDNMAVRLER